MPPFFPSKTKSSQRQHKKPKELCFPQVLFTTVSLAERP